MEDLQTNIWRQLEDIFEHMQFSELRFFLKDLNPSGVNFFNVAHLAQVFSNLHLNNPVAGSDRRIAGYALTSGLCYIYSLHMKEAEEVLEWMKENDVLPEVMELLKNEILQAKKRTPFEGRGLLTNPGKESFKNQTPKAERTFQVIPTSLLANLSPQEFVELTKQAQIKHLKKNQTLFREGDLPGAFYVIVDGCVSLDSSLGFQKKMEVGNFFGELGLISGIRRTATIKALQATKLLEFSKACFERTIHKFPSLSQKIYDYHQLRLFLTSLIRVQAFENTNEKKLKNIYQLFRTVDILEGENLNAEEVYESHVMMVVDGELEKMENGIQLQHFGPGEVLGNSGNKVNIAYHSPTGCRLLVCNEESYQKAKTLAIGIKSSR